MRPDSFVDTAAAFHALVEGIREGAAILALDHTVLTCNRRLAQMLKLQCDQVMGNSMTQFISPEDQPAFEKLLASASDEFQRVPLRLSGANPFPLPVDLAVKSLDVGGGRVFSLLATDLSRRRRAEEQLAFQSHLLANVSDAVLAMDEHFRITYWNPAAERLYGWTADEVLGRTVSEVVHPDLSPEQKRELNQRLAETGVFDNESVHRRKDGADILVESRRIALRAPDGRMIGYVSLNRNITAQKQQEQRLRSSEERFAKAFRASPLPMVISALEDGRMMEANPSSQRLFGYREDELVGHTSLELGLYPRPQDRHRLIAMLKEGQRVSAVPQSLRKRSGDIVDTLISMELIELHGQPAIVTIVEDITEQKRAEDEIRRLNAELEHRVQERTARLDTANQKLEREIEEHQRVEEALRESEGRFRTLVTSVKEGFTLNQVLYDANGELHDLRVIEANPAAEIANGLKREDFVGKTWRELWPGAEEYWWDICRMVVFKGEHVVYENYASLHDRWYEVRQFPAGPNLMGSLFTDITDRKRAEQERERMLAQIEQERARWQGVVEGIADEVWIANAEGRMSLINLPDVTAMGLEEFEYKTVAEVYEEVDILYLDGQPRPQEQAPLLRSLRGEIVRGEEIMRHRQTGKTRYRQFSSAPTRDASGSITGAVAIVRDVTEYKKAEQEIVRLNEILAQRATELESANRELESFSYSVSHDLRAPLSSILGMARAAQADYAGQLPSNLDQYLRFIQENAENLDRLIQALLAFSRASRQPLNKARVNVQALVEEVWRDLEPQRAGRHVEINVGALPDADADPVLFRQVLVNLLSNALKFTRPRAVARIEVDSYKRNGDTVYVVKDNGVGFDPDDTDKLFQVFQRLHSEDEFEGTGLGLALVERIVRRHGGYVCADAILGQGAAFYVTLEGREDASSIHSLAPSRGETRTSELLWEI